MKLYNYSNFLNESISKELETFMLNEYGCSLEENGKWSTIDKERGHDVYINNDSLIVKDKKLQIKFGSICGNFYIHGLTLTTLEGCPEFVRDQFTCSGNNIINLNGGPKYAGEGYKCIGCNLKTLEGAPEEVLGSAFDCSNNDIKNLIGLKNSTFEHSILAKKNYSLSEFIEFPEAHTAAFSDCGLTSLKGLPKKMYYLNIEDNYLESLEGAPEIIEGSCFISFNDLKTFYGGPKHIEFINLNNIGSIKKVEKEWYALITSNGKGYKDYYKELLTYVLLKHPTEINSINWPDGFLNDNLKKSAEVLGKFKL